MKDLLTISEASKYTEGMGQRVSPRGLRFACAKGYIPDAMIIGRDWLIKPAGLMYYLANRPKRGPKARSSL